MRLIAALLLAALGCQATDFVTAVSAAATRNNFAGHVGMKFTVGASTLYITGLGRYCTFGNSASHTVYIVRASDEAVMASAAVNMSGCTTSTFRFAAATATLAAGTAYYIVSGETSGGDNWLDDTTAGMTTTAAATVTNSAYSLTAPGTTPSGFATNASGVFGYVPTSFQYTLTAPGGSSPASIIF